MHFLRLEADVALPISNPIFQEFCGLGLIDPAAIEFFAERTRDCGIPVYRDCKSKIIFLESVATSPTYYSVKEDGTAGSAQSVVSIGDNEPLALPSLEDSTRRVRQFEDEIRGCVVCDFGTGYGDFLKCAQGLAAKCYGVELRRQCLDWIATSGIDADVRSSIAAHDVRFDLVTMFHVLEHISDQVGVLRDLAASINPGGKAIVEVPHAEDFLIQSVDIPEFRAFTFWSEHLVLHTRASLRRVMEEAGFRDVEIRPYQRYGFTNHLYWMLERKPGGHQAYARFEKPELECAYKAAREADFTCDTLIAIGSV